MGVSFCGIRDTLGTELGLVNDVPVLALRIEERSELEANTEGMVDVDVVEAVEEREEGGRVRMGGGGCRGGGLGVVRDGGGVIVFVLGLRGELEGGETGWEGGRGGFMGRWGNFGGVLFAVVMVFVFADASASQPHARAATLGLTAELGTETSSKLSSRLPSRSSRVLVFVLAESS